MEDVIRAHAESRDPDRREITGPSPGPSALETENNESGPPKRTTDLGALARARKRSTIPPIRPGAPGRPTGSLPRSPVTQKKYDIQSGGLPRPPSLPHSRPGDAHMGPRSPSPAKRTARHPALTAPPKEQRADDPPVKNGDEVTTLSKPRSGESAAFRRYPARERYSRPGRRSRRRPLPYCRKR